MEVENHDEVAGRSITFNELTGLLELVPPLRGLAVNRLLVDYDAEADVLYVSFRRPQKATDSELREDGIIVRKHGKRIVGITILDALARLHGTIKQ